MPSDPAWQQRFRGSAPGARQSVASAELAASLSARGVRTTAVEAEAARRAFADRSVAEREGRWTLTREGAEVARGLRSLEGEGE